MGVLKVRVNGVWEEIGVPEPPLDEVWVGAGPPDPVGTYEIWVDNTVDPAVLHFQNQIGEWHEVDTGNEVTISTSDPYNQPGCKDELWVDTSGGAPGVLKARLGGTTNPHWEELIRFGGVSFEQNYGMQPFPGFLNVAARADHTHGTPGQEVIRGDDAPTEDTADLWWDTSLVPPVLKAREGNTDTWVPVDSASEPPLDEVWVGTARPDPASTYEVWYNTSSLPGVLYAKRESGEWEVAGDNEVHIGVEDPYVLNPDSKAELWHDISIGQAGKLKARIGGQWVPVAEFTESEVEIGPTDPISHGIPAGTTELWVDTSSTPPTLMGWVNGGWQQLTGPDPMIPQEVHIGPSDPMDQMTELWYDTTLSPKGTLYANNNGVWESVGGTDEIVVGADPYLTDATSEVKMWYDTTLGVPGKLYVRVGGGGINGVWQEAYIAGNGVSFATNYGMEPKPGQQLSYSREDHNHGTPPPEVWVGDQDPYTRNPVQPVELWYDTSVA